MDHGRFQLLLLGRQVLDLAQLPGLQIAQDTGQGLVDASVELPSLLDTFSSDFLIGGCAAALVAHKGSPRWLLRPASAP
ncbi:hypothetical protein DFK10_03260 [Salibaculum griseiflavum]|uniref:Uncharacterized protein n=1 Tax=Salibaculum griseiflavum TaxID=1914409 RepID=A0A2V1P941_9RHOB|nr:hypothetical protein DFK10_03260 [Salibaculum griseiflavum]